MDEKTIGRYHEEVYEIYQEHLTRVKKISKRTNFGFYTSIAIGLVGLGMVIHSSNSSREENTRETLEILTSIRDDATKLEEDILNQHFNLEGGLINSMESIRGQASSRIEAIKQTDEYKERITKPYEDLQTSLKVMATCWLGILASIGYSTFSTRRSSSKRNKQLDELKASYPEF